MAVITLSELIRRIRSKAQIQLDPAGVNNSSVNDTEILDWINEGIADLMSLIIDSNSDHYLDAYNITADGVNKAYNLPDNFYQLRGVDYNTSSTTAITVPSYSFAERNTFNAAFDTIQGAAVYQYRLQGSQHPSSQQIIFQPLPSAGVSFTVHYIPSITMIGALDDGYQPNFNFLNGYEEYVINYAVIECKDVDEGDYTKEASRLERLKERILKGTVSRDKANPRCVTDVAELESWGYRRWR